MNTPTPETDLIWAKVENILDHARKLERERDEARRLVEELRGVDNLHPLAHK